MRFSEGIYNGKKKYKKIKRFIIGENDKWMILMGYFYWLGLLVDDLI